MSMEPSTKHPHTGKPNMRYMTVVFSLEDGAQESAWRDLLAELSICESPSFAPQCRVTAMGCGDAMSELEKLEDES